MKSSLKFKPASVGSGSSATSRDSAVGGAPGGIVRHMSNEQVIARYRRHEARLALVEYQGALRFLPKFGDEVRADAPFHAALRSSQFGGFLPELVSEQHHSEVAGGLGGCTPRENRWKERSRGIEYDVSPTLTT